MLLYHTLCPRQPRAIGGVQLHVVQALWSLNEEQLVRSESYSLHISKRVPGCRTVPWPQRKTSEEGAKFVSPLCL